MLTFIYGEPFKARLLLRGPTVYDLYAFEHSNRPNRPTTQPAYRLKVKNLHNFDIFQPIWLKLGVEPLNGRT